MNLRELLQTEIWSKRTTRKILVWFGIVFGTLVVVFGTWYAIETHWLTSGERIAGRVALAEIDTLQSLGSASDENFYAKANEAEGKVEIAQLTARTSRDKDVAFSLSSYLLLTRMQRDDLVMRERLKERHEPRLDSELESDRDMDSKNEDTRKLVRSILHRALD